MELTPPKKRKMRALRMTIALLTISVMAFVWLWRQIMEGISAMMRSPLALQMAVTAFGALLITVMTVPKISSVVRRYVRALKDDLRSLRSGLRMWSREQEFIRISREALRDQIEAIREEVYD